MQQLEKLKCKFFMAGAIVGEIGMRMFMGGAIVREVQHVTHCSRLKIWRSCSVTFSWQVRYVVTLEWPSSWQVQYLMTLEGLFLRLAQYLRKL